MCTKPFQGRILIVTTIMSFPGESHISGQPRWLLCLSTVCSIAVGGVSCTARHTSKDRHVSHGQETEVHIYYKFGFSRHLCSPYLQWL